MSLTRRSFLELTGLAGAAALVGREVWALQFLEPIRVDNPLAQYPSRDWEVVYRDIWRHDSKFVFLCAPNDTHNCLLEAHVRNGVIVRIEPTYGTGVTGGAPGNLGGCSRHVPGRPLGRLGRHFRRHGGGCDR